MKSEFLLYHTIAACPQNAFDAERQAVKDEAAEDGKKKKGGVQIPDEWPWEEAKRVFEKPDVTPADEIEARSFLSPVNAQI